MKVEYTCTKHKKTWLVGYTRLEKKEVPICPECQREARDLAQKVAA